MGKSMLVTFSGLDGSGKSTLCQKLCEKLYKSGILYHQIHIIPWSLANHIGHWLGIEDSNLPSRKRSVDDIKPLGRLETWARLFTIFIDIIRFHIIFHRFIKSKRFVLIIDRYFWDLLIKLEYCGWNGSLIKNFLLRLIPQPDLPLYIDVEPDTAYERKPEHSREYYQIKSRLYENAVTPSTIRLFNKDIDIATEQLFSFVRDVSKTT